MRGLRFSRAVFGLWLGILALAANALEQQQLGANILYALQEDARALDDPSAPPTAFHVMSDGTVMAGSMAHHGEAGGHTHRGHADCDVCGAVAAMAAVTLPALTVVPTPTLAFLRYATAPPVRVYRGDPPSAYSSRAPPSLT